MSAAEQTSAAAEAVHVELSDPPTAEPDEFETIKQIGAGSFGKVFKVVHKATGEIYALKRLNREAFEKGKIMRYAVTERKVLSFARHPYIVRLHYSFDTATHIGLVMTYCPRGDLQQLLKIYKTGARLSAERIRHYAAEILLALEYLHANKILYRDLKPANVILDEEWHALLTDFGLSKEKAEGQAKTYVGSLAFMAPEILNRKGHNHSADIYGLGVMVYAMFDSDGKPPFFTADADALKRSIRQSALAVPAHVPTDAASFIVETMNRKPSERPGAACTADARGHVFFGSVDFEALMRREVPVPDLTPEVPSKGLALGKAPPPAGPCRRFWKCYA